ncbi:hypothetical protein [Formosa agariphila]|nr:hypothetical protein [Formosa agariphila]
MTKSVSRSIDGTVIFIKVNAQNNGGLELNKKVFSCSKNTKGVSILKKSSGNKKIF